MEDPLERLDAAGVGEQEVEQHQVRLAGAKLSQRGLKRQHVAHRKGKRDRAGEDVGRDGRLVGVVLDEQHERGG